MSGINDRFSFVFPQVCEIDPAMQEVQRYLYPEVRPVLMPALHTSRSHVQRDPEVVLRYLADMGIYHGTEWWLQDTKAHRGKETRPMGILKEPARGDDILTLAEATLLHRAFFPADEQIDLSNLIPSCAP